MDNNFLKLKTLPQVSAPYTYVLSQLKKNNIDFKKIKLNASKYKPLQAVVSLQSISNINRNEIDPIWVAKDKSVLDGHHRQGSALADNDSPLEAIQINLDLFDAIDALKKIQYLYEYEQKMNVEEVVANNQINMSNDIDSGVSTSEFLATLENETKEEKQVLMDRKTINSKRKTVKAYRKKPINEKSKVGNFFSLKPIDGYREYEIEFESLLDTDDMDLLYNRVTNPTLVLSKAWFPHIDFDKISKKYKVSSEALINRAITEKAKKMGYDGIKYGDIMIQGLD